MTEGEVLFSQLTAQYFAMLLNANGTKSSAQWHTAQDNGNALEWLGVAENMANFQLANAVIFGKE